MELQGKIIRVLQPQEGIGKNGNPWKVQPYVLETLETYPRKVYFEVYGEDRINQNPCDVDDTVTIFFDIESREFNGRWFTVVRAWKITKGTEQQPKGNVVTPDTKPAKEPEPANNPNPQSDLPF